MRNTICLALTAAALMLGSCGGSGDAGPPIAGATAITIVNTSSVPRTIMHQRFYNYDTGEFIPDDVRIPPDGEFNSFTFILPRGGTWNVDVDFAQGIGPHGNFPNPPWIGDVDAGVVEFWRNW